MARPPISDPPRRPRRLRVLSEDERLLWEGVARSARPLRKPRKPRLPAAAPEPGEPPPAPPPAFPAAPTRPGSPPLAPLARRDRARIARGRTGIEARLDLHGMTLARAHGVLRRFLVRAQGEGLTLVLVITGKGGRDGNGVLRREVPQWLALAEFRGLVIGFEEAHAAHGGAGALYVRVRRGR